MKRFKVVAESTVMDAEVNVICEGEAHEMFEKFRDSGSYHRVYIMDNETGELYDTFDKSIECGGVKIEIWSKL